MTAHPLFAEIKRLTESLIAVPSVSPHMGAENACAEKIAELLRAPYSDSTEAPPLNPIFWPTGDGRKSVACLLPSLHPQNAGRTILLMGHFDTVGVQDFVSLAASAGLADSAALAFSPGELHRVLNVVLDAKNHRAELTDLDRSAFESLHTGDWLFGRGALDMKSGLAILIALLREFARTQPDGTRAVDSLRGNLLFLACPDEETESVGVLSALENLISLRIKNGLNYLGAINADYTAPRGADDSARYVYSGTVGKLLPSFYILGSRTHVGEIFRGVDASHIAAELVSAVNLSPDWMDSWTGVVAGIPASEVTVPPVALQMRDLKASYNVETAGEAFVYFNLLTHALTPTAALTIMHSAAESALDRVRARREQSYRQFESRRGQAPPPPAWNATVVEYAQLIERVRAAWDESKMGQGFEAWLESRARAISAATKDGREVSQKMVAEVAAVSGLAGPAVVLFFGPPYYPSIQPQSNALTDALVRTLRNFDEPIQLRAFYPYISDLSYLSLDRAVNVDDLVRNLPIFGLTDAQAVPLYPLTRPRLDAMRQLNCPLLNIGPFGRDAHGLYERVHMPYSFGILPQVIFETVRQALA